MNYAVVKFVNGNFAIDSEWNDNIHGAIIQWHSVCRALWGDTATKAATVVIVDENLREIENGKYREYISHADDTTPNLN